MQLPPVTNTDYGQRVFRRRIRLIAGPGAVRAALEDTGHAMRLVLQHDAGRITAITPEFRRFPLDTCPGAAGPLRALIGMPLDTPMRRMLTEHNPRAHCTHVYDLTLLAMAHALREGSRQYDVEVPDEHPAPAWSRVLRDGVEVHRWQTLEQRIVAPEPFAGLPLIRGFLSWASERFGADPEALEAAVVFSKGYMVSTARRFDMDAQVGIRAEQLTMMHGACYSYSPPAVTRAVRVKTIRDLTNVGDELLDDFS